MLNNKGFAITTILYGILILFLMLLLAMLGILNNYKDNISKLIEAKNGSRTIISEKTCITTDENILTGDDTTGYTCTTGTLNSENKCELTNQKKCLSPWVKK